MTLALGDTICAAGTFTKTAEYDTSSSSPFPISIQDPYVWLYPRTWCQWNDMYTKETLWKAIPPFADDSFKARTDISDLKILPKEQRQKNWESDNFLLNKGTLAEIRAQDNAYRLHCAYYSKVWGCVTAVSWMRVAYLLLSR